MKKIIILLSLFCVPMTASAGDDQYYTVYDEQSDTTKTRNELSEDKIETRSESIIKSELGNLKNEIKTLKNQMYNEIRKLRQSF
ncbi:MAG: hypothetical protein A2Y25_10885 [Candidatus Melainabacteria bacterium GWF2_37_15]|nr:MAG: hypothetical protein A2Y25_10885 [Candidatus Melainabacteria bacterium GWF2_37_15]